jgi:GalNAc-alpha-(1->4)-GalNAc-alpha-(1->3)-diNAcBac-PP-undecaprenol alpha-1,4-N-acetyl-D-galactosaminyltransferase
MKKIKILILTNALSPAGGAERVVSILANGFSNNYDVTVLCTHVDANRSEFSFNEQVSINYIKDLNNHNYFNRFSGYLKKIFLLRKFLIKNNYDIVISFLTNVNVLILISSFRLKVPVIISERSYPPFMYVGTILKILRALLYNYASSIVVQTKVTDAWRKKIFPRLNSKIIPNPVDFPLINETPVLNPDNFLDPKKKTLLSVGRLDKGKNHKDTILAFSLLIKKHPNLQLVIVGDGPESLTLKELTKKLGINKSVFFLGRIGNVGNWYERSDFFVLSSKFEGFPNVLVEAMAYGIPVISYDCQAGPSEIIVNGVNGFLVKIDDGPAGLASVVDRLILDKNLCKDVGLMAQEIKDSLSVSCILNLWKELIFYHIKK